VRYTGISFVYQFSGIFASGITPIVATALLKSGGGEPWQICMYVVVRRCGLGALRVLDRTRQAGRLNAG